MIIWKTHNLNIRVASFRYRCIFPARYLENIGYSSMAYGEDEPVYLSKDYHAIIFTKSFSNKDIETAKRAYSLGIPVIIDLCDNIFIKGYGNSPKNEYAENFNTMAGFASAIVTTGLPLKDIIEEKIENSVPVYVIPDGSENLDDVEFSSQFVKVKRWLTLRKSRPIDFLIITTQFCIYGMERKLELKAKSKRIYNQWKSLFISARKKFISARKKLIQAHLKLKEYVKIFLSILGIWTKLPEESNNEIENEAQTYERKSKSYTNSEEIVNSNSEDTNNFSIIAIEDEVIDEILDKNLVATSTAPKAFQDSSIPPEYVPPSPQPSNNLSSQYSSTNIGDNNQTVLWFGNHGASYGNFGMLNILEVSTALTEIHKEIGIQLLVVSNNHQKYLDHIEPLGFPSRYIEWHQTLIYKYIAASDVVIIPNSKTNFSICKSANRAILALSLGIPVVASKTPALEIFEKCVIFDEWEFGLKSYLNNPELVDTHIHKAQNIIEQNYSGPVIANHWVDVLKKVKQKK